MGTGNRLNTIFRVTMVLGKRPNLNSCRLLVPASSPAVLSIPVRRRLHWLTDILGSSEPINQWFEKLHEKYPPTFDPFGLRSNVCCEIYEFVAPGGYRVGPFKIELHILKLPQNIFLNYTTHFCSENKKKSRPNFWLFNILGSFQGSIDKHIKSF